MVSKTKIIWTIREITECMRQRQLNQFDVNIGVSGARGDGKSTLLFKLFNSFKKSGFNPDKHQIYERKDIMKLLSSQTFSFCWDDEAINSGYKRNFQEKGQHELIKLVTNYRDNYNIYASALPFFYSLDKDLRALIFIHFHIVERGVAVIFMPISTHIHSEDPWDTKANIKIEERENKRLTKNPNMKFRYNKFTTFAGYVYFGDMTKKQRIKYEEIKKRKRAIAFNIEEVKTEYLSFNEKMYKALIERNLTKDFLLKSCLIEGKKYSSVAYVLNTFLRDRGVGNTLDKIFREQRKKSEPSVSSNSSEGISELVPDI